MSSKRDPSKPYPHDKLLHYMFLRFIPKKITPNAITIFRFVMTPFVLWFLVTEQFVIGVPLFVAVAFTDAMDGSLARMRDKVTEWGTFYDPVADKLLISTTVLLIVIKYINALFAILIIGIELLIIYGGYRQRKERGGKPISANIYGKIKMCLQVVAVTSLLIAAWSGVSLFIPFSIGTFALAIVFAVISLFTYSL